MVSEPGDTYLTEQGPHLPRAAGIPVSVQVLVVVSHCVDLDTWHQPVITAPFDAVALRRVAALLHALMNAILSCRFCRTQPADEARSWIDRCTFATSVRQALIVNGIGEVICSSGAGQMTLQEQLPDELDMSESIKSSESGVPSSVASCDHYTIETQSVVGMDKLVHKIDNITGCKQLVTQITERLRKCHSCKTCIMVQIIIHVAMFWRNVCNHQITIAAVSAE
eukprot:6483997-Amphidinium_carterae.1